MHHLTVHKIAKSLVVALALASATPGAAQEPQSIVLSIQDARTLAANALANGQIGLAEQVALGLLQRDPNDFEALMILSTARMRQGNFKGAADTGKRAFRTAPAKPARMIAARLVASAHFRAKQYTRAQWWLRRATNSATTQQDKIAIAQDFAIVRQKNPFTAQLSFSIAPNDNINNGSSSEFITIWNLPFILSADARALSGIETSASAVLHYRLSETKNQATSLGLTLFGRSYKLSGETRRVAPNVRAGDYAFGLAEISLSHIRKFDAMSGPTSFTLSLGQNWYGGKPLNRYQRLNISQMFQLSASTQVGVNLGYEQQADLRNNSLGSEIYTVGTTLQHALSNGDQVGFQLSQSETKSFNTTLENNLLAAKVSYGIGTPIWGMQVSMNLGAEKRDYDQSVYAANGRHDLSLSAGATVVFLNAQYFGFSPSVTLETRRTESNISLFDRKSSSLRFGIQSSF